jgi:hypothetical protein
MEKFEDTIPVKGRPAVFKMAMPADNVVDVDDVDADDVDA